MKLNTLIKYKKPKRRLGRGIAAGQGKTAGRGTKGQKARAGKTLRPGFEGGQTPLLGRIPKYRGFHNINRVEFQIINVQDLENLGLTKVTKETLLGKRMIRKKTMPVKVLGRGELSRAVEVALDAASQAAIDKITTAGGSFTATLKKRKVTPKKTYPGMEQAKTEETEDSDKS